MQNVGEFAMWRYLTLVSYCFFITLVVALSPTSAMAFTTFSEAQRRELPSLGNGSSPIPLWEQLRVERGDTLWDFCSAFMRAVPIEGLDHFGCLRQLGAINGFERADQYHQIPLNAVIWMPSMTNDPAVVQARVLERRAAASAAAADEAELRTLAENPMGMASAIRELLAGRDAAVERLEALESTQLTTEGAEAMISAALAAGGFATQTELAALDTTLRRFIADNPGLTASDVSAQIAAALSGLQIPDEESIRAIVAAETAALSARVGTLERNLGVIDNAVAGHTTDIAALQDADRAAADAVATETARVNTALDAKADVQTVSAIETRLSAVEDGQSLWYIIGAALLALAALGGTVYLYFTKASQRAVAVVAERVTALEHKVAFVAMLHIKGMYFEGKLPTQADIDQLGNGDSIVVRLQDDNGLAGEVTFTARDDALPGGKRGLEVKGIKDIRGAIAPTIARMSSTIGAAIEKGKLVHPSDKTVVGMPLPVGGVSAA
jgi:hypothetical protein